MAKDEMIDRPAAGKSCAGEATILFIDRARDIVSEVISECITPLADSYMTSMEAAEKVLSALCLGVDTSDFVTSAAYREAINTLMSQSRTVLDERASRAFFIAMDAVLEPSRAMKDLMAGCDRLADDDVGRNDINVVIAKQPDRAQIASRGTVEGIGRFQIDWRDV